MRQIRLIAHDIRSTHNVGALLRTCECFGVETVYLTGYTPYPQVDNDPRLPHISANLSRKIHKTALGAESLVRWEHHDNIEALILELREQSFTIVGLEQTPSSISLPRWSPPHKIAWLLGREVEGIEKSLLAQCDYNVEIPQFGQKESLNVVQAAAVAVYCSRTKPLAA